MAKKKSVKNSRKKIVSRKRISKSNSFEKIEKELISEVEEAEKWIFERRKFLIKLLWLLILISALLVVSNYLFRV